MTNRSYVLGGMILVALLEACGFEAAGSVDSAGAGGSSAGGGEAGTGGAGGGEFTGATSAGSGGDAGPVSLADCVDSTGIVEKIEQGKAGEVFLLDGCTLAGPITIPAGVTVKGQGIGLSRITTKAGTFALKLMPGSQPTRLEGLSVVSSGTAAIAGKGAGKVALADVEITLTRGVGVAFEALSELSLSNVSVTGPVTARGANAFPADVLPKNTATHGVVVVDVDDVTLDTVNVRGMADYGAVFVGSTLTWTKGGASENLGTGLLISGGTASLTGVSLCGALQGTRKVPAYNGVLLTGTKVTSSDLTVCDSGAMGLLQVSSMAKHVNLSATGNAGPAVWVQKSPSFELAGASNLIDQNQFAGLVFIDVDKVQLANTKVANTKLASRPFGAAGGNVQLGDGIQLVRSAAAVSFDSVSLTGNAHTGFQIDLGPNDVTNPLFHMKWTGVTADASGTAFGALCQGSPGNVGTVWGPGIMGWDTGILRTGAAAINDVLVIDPNESVGVIDPNEISRAP